MMMNRKMKILIAYDGSSHADGADLIVLGSRGLGGFKRFLLGSVA
jgi:nucleotide-binding universal stress UspA family protein